MKHITLFLGSLIAISFSCISCSEDETTTNSSRNSTSFSDIVFQKRDNKLPDIKTYPIEQQSTRAFDKSEAININGGELLGYSYKMGNSMLGDISNKGYSIIDLAKVDSYNSDYITYNKLPATNVDYDSYCSIDEFLEKSNYVKKTSSGFRLNFFKLFKIGRKKKTTEIFASYINDSIHSVYAEVNVKQSSKQFNLASSEAELQVYPQGFIKKGFTKALYGSTVGNMLNTYGEFIIAGYITGAKATALIASSSRSTIDIQDKEKLMNESYDGFLKLKVKKGLIKATLDSLSFGKDNSNLTVKMNNFDRSTAHIYTYGGRNGLSITGESLDMKQSSIDLSNWAKTLDDESTHTLIDFPERSLLPISSIILEDNYKKRYDRTVAGILPSLDRLATPYIEIARYFVRYSTSLRRPLYNTAAILNTRQGDKIILCSKLGKDLSDAELNRNIDNTYFMERAKEISEKLKKYFEIEIRTNLSARYDTQILNPLFEIVLCNGDNLHWTVNKRSGIRYIYDKANKVAFSIYDDDLDGDYVLDDYGIRDWYDDYCTEKPISSATIIRNFKIIGL